MKVLAHVSMIILDSWGSTSSLFFRPLTKLHAKKHTFLRNTNLNFDLNYRLYISQITIKLKPVCWLIASNWIDDKMTSRHLSQT